MGEIKEVGLRKPSGKQQHLLKPLPGMELEVKDYLLPGEHVVYHAGDIFFTDRRIIKHKQSALTRHTHFFYRSFEDLDYRFLESMCAKNVVNLRLTFWSVFVFLLGPIAFFLGSIPGLRWLGEFLMLVLVDGLGLGGIFLIGVVLLVAAVVLRDRVIEFRSSGTILRTKHLPDTDLVKVRELQLIRLKRLGLEK